MNQTAIKIGLQQRVLAEYRIPFFEALGSHFDDGLSLFFGDARPEEMVEQGKTPQHCNLVHAHNLDLFRGRFYTCWQIGILQWLNHWNPDVLVLEANPRYISQTSAVNWMHQRNKPVIGWGLGAPETRGLMNHLQKNLRNRFLSQFDAMITYSQAGAASYRAAGIKAQRIFVAYNAVTPRPVTPMVKRPLDVNGKRLSVLFVGRLQARKRVNLLIQACGSMPEDLQPDLVVVGDGPEKENLENLAREKYPHTQFAGSKFGQELTGLFKQADLFVLPGTGGLAIQEAMSYGLPVIAAEADGTQADLVRPENGWRIIPGDQEHLNRSLLDALKDITRLRRYGQESYRIVSEEINLEKMVEVFSQATQYVLEVRKQA